MDLRLNKLLKNPLTVQKIHTYTTEIRTMILLHITISINIAQGWDGGKNIELTTRGLECSRKREPVRSTASNDVSIKGNAMVSIEF